VKESFSVEVRKPLKEVFESLTDIERLASMSGGKVTVNHLAERPRRGKGSAVLLIPAVPGQQIEPVLCETLEWEPPKRCARRFGIKDLPTTVEFRLEELPDGTRIHVDVELEPQSLMYKMMLPALALKFRSEKEKFIGQLQAELAKLDGPDGFKPV
jgi:uncharacterized protein YndB with AHSA1/START domain